MKIIVTTCPKYQHLVSGFTEHFNKEWGDEFILDVAEEGESWSSQLIRICNSIQDDYFVRLCEDFWITKFDREAFERASDMAKFFCADRVGLQSTADYAPCTEPFVEGFEKMKRASEYMCSMEASIYRRWFLLNNLTEGKHIWETEVEMSRKTPDATILIPTKRILEYKDATRRGQSRVDGIPDVCE